jgi:hypothetical protein
MQRPLVTVTVAMLLAGTACGGGTSGDPLVSTTLTGQFKGQPFKPAFGVATVYQGSNVIALGDGALDCASAQQNDPPMGTTATFSVPMLAVGTYSSVFVDLVQYEAQNLDGVGSSDATVMLTAVGASSVAGTIAYSYTDSTGGAYGLSGSFEVSRCPM